MSRQAIDFRELLDRVLPLEDLPRVRHQDARHGLRAGMIAEIEQAGRAALTHLEERGAPRRLPPGERARDRLTSGPSREAIDRASVRPPSLRARDGVFLHLRTTLPAHASAPLDQVRRLLHLDDPLLSSDPRRGDARQGLIERLGQVGRQVLGASEVRFVSTSDLDEGGGGSLDPDLAREARANPGVIYYCPDTQLSLRLEEARRRGVRSLAMAGVVSSGGDALGVVEASSSERELFRAEGLAMVALLADSCAGVLERAARIEKLVFIDPLTLAYNRSYFDLHVQKEMARAEREHSSMALCIVDIDDFKSFNSSYGYQAGNRVLVQVAESLKRAVRPFDTVARWGGEEFTVLLTAPIQAQDVRTISERLRSLVERQTVRIESLDRRSHHVVVTVSIGVALFPDHERTADDLWRAANEALLEAKRPPKNRVVFYTPPPDSPASPTERS